MSEPEPELGLGVVRGVKAGKVKLWFPASAETRIYAWPGAPLARVKFAPGERVAWEGGGGVVQSARQQEHVLWYTVDGREVAEASLSGILSRRGLMPHVRSTAERV